jgi:hypothetical protein
LGWVTAARLGGRGEKVRRNWLNHGGGLRKNNEKTASSALPQGAKSYQ